MLSQIVEDALVIKPEMLRDRDVRNSTVGCFVEVSYLILGNIEAKYYAWV